ncbi:hypothetical protein ERJ75_001191200 [Trypanosoma vivax]|nr:hypothetical protein ERJ75_001191200 [Trypanosoma vivax]
MSKKTKSSAPPEPLSSSFITLSCTNMVCIQSSDGHLFLVDRNCATVSGVLRSCLQSRKAENKDTAGTVPPVSATPSHRANEPASFEVGLEAAPAAETSPFSAGGSSTTNAPHIGDGSSWHTRTSRVWSSPIPSGSVMYNSTAESTVSADSTPISSTGAFITAKVCRPDMCSEVKIGSETYEMITLDEVSSDLLDLALESMYYKYKYDPEAEKRPPEPPRSSDVKHRLTALSVLLDM